MFLAWLLTDKIDLVKKERGAIISFTEKRLRALGNRPDSPVDTNMTAKELREAEARRASAMVELVSASQLIEYNRILSKWIVLFLNRKKSDWKH